MIVCPLCGIEPSPIHEEYASCECRRLEYFQNDHTMWTFRVGENTWLCVDDRGSTTFWNGKTHVPVHPTRAARVG